MLSRLLVLILLLANVAPARAQFVDSFDSPRIDGWFTMVGDGTPGIRFLPMEGFARMDIDGTTDPHNVWWTLIKRDISASVDLEKLKDPAYELRVEARIRVSHAPRRLNFMINTQRTTDFHEHLREYDLPDTTNWHVISMTTRDLDVVPGDSLFVQLGATDFGPGKYQVDIDYYRADVVKRADAAPDLGEPLIYHTTLPPPASFQQHLPVSHDSIVSSDFPRVNFNDWSMAEGGGRSAVLTLGVTQFPILRWDFSALRGRKVDGPAILELTTATAPKGGNYVQALGEDFGIEFGKVRVFEIIGGDPEWDQQTVSYASLLRGEPVTAVFNGQMTFDADLTEQPGGKTLLTLPRPVMQRLLDGRTKGLVLRPLGLVAASFYASEDAQKRGPVLHVNLQK